MNRVKAFVFRWWPIIVIFFLSALVTLINLGLQKDIVGNDAGVGVMFPKTLHDLTFYTWNSSDAPGRMNLTSSLNLNWKSLILLLHAIGFSSVFVPRFIFFLFFFVSGTGMYLFLRTVFHFLLKENKSNYIVFGCFTGALFYMFNHYSMWITSFPIYPYHLSYMFLPWVLAFFVRNVFGKTSLVYAVLFTIVLSFMGGGNPSNTLSALLLMLIMFLYFYKNIPDIRKKVIFLCIPVGILFLALTVYVWLPMIFQGNSPYDSEILSSNFLGPIQLHSTYASFPNIFLLGGSVAWHIFPYYDTYIYSPFFIVLGFLIIIFALASLISHRHAKVKLFFLIVFVVSLFLTKGTHPPFREFFLALFTNIPYYGIFRALYPKFAFYGVLSVSVFLSLQVFELASKKLFFTISLLLMLYHFPFFTGQVLQKEHLTRLPQQYLSGDVQTLLDDRYRILSLPATPKGAGPIFRWGQDLYTGAPTDPFFFHREVLDGYWFFKKGFIGLTHADSWHVSAFEKNSTQFLPLMKILNVKYFVLHKDMVNEYTFASSPGPQKIDGKRKARLLEETFKRTDELSKLYTSNIYDVYVLRDDLTVPKMYIPEMVIKSSDQEAELKKIFKTNITQKRFAIVPPVEFTQASSAASIQLGIRKINPTLYRVNVVNPFSEPFFLIFSETYNSKWKAYLQPRSDNASPPSFLGNFLVWYYQLQKKLLPLDESQHMTANSFANAWYIDVKTLPGNYTIYISFEPQLYFLAGLFISIVTLVAISTAIVVNRIKTRRFSR